MKIYFLMPETLPGAEALQAELSKAYTLASLSSLDDLSSCREEKAVVLLGAPTDKLPTRIGVVRSMAPKLGVIAVVDQKQLDGMTSDQVNQADLLVMPCHPVELSARINAALQLSELRHLIEDSAQLDDITELYNHHYFIKRLGEEMSLAKRHLSPLSCVIIGISYYDVYLDSYGYQFVANFMNQVARVIKEQVRAEDIVARIGNSEIAFLLPRSSEKGSMALTRRIINKVEDISVFMGDQVEHLHLNAGIAGYPSADEAELDPDTLVRYARHALHHAKCQENIKIQLFSEMKPFVG